MITECIFNHVFLVPVRADSLSKGYEALWEREAQLRFNDLRFPSPLGFQRRHKAKRPHCLGIG